MQTLSRRIDGRLTTGAAGPSSNKRSSGMFPDYDARDGAASNGDDTAIDYEEMKRLRDKVCN